MDEADIEGSRWCSSGVHGEVSGITYGDRSAEPKDPRDELYRVEVEEEVSKAQAELKIEVDPVLLGPKLMAKLII